MIVIFTKTKRVVAVGDENTNADELLKQCQEKYPDIGCWAYATTQANYEDTIQMAVRPIMLKEEIDHMRHQNKAEQLDMNALQALISLTATLATTQYIYESHFLFEGTDLPEDDKRDYNNWWNVKMSLIG
ncbi:MAG: hypothetical protein ACXVLT_05250, partial [Flavisolibacter sp.]